MQKIELIGLKSTKRIVKDVDGVAIVVNNK